jgi:hypothetical protein
MRLVRYLYANVNLLNVALLAAITVVVLFVVMPLLRMSAKGALPQVKVKAVEQEKHAEEKQTPSPLDFAMIGENNLFHPERRIPPLKTDEKALPKPELVLYGTIIGDGTTVAYIEDKKAPRTTPGRGARQQVVKKGDVLSGFVVREIEADKIVLMRGEETMVVRLSQEKKGRGSAPSTGTQAAPRPGAAGPGAAPGRATPARPPQPPAQQPPNISQGGKLNPPTQPVNPARNRREGLQGP